MATNTRTTFDAVLKEFYEGTIRDILNSKTFLLNRVKKDSKSWSGRRVVYPVNTGRNEGIGARSENETLPTAQLQEYTEVRITPRYMYGRFEVTGPLMASSNGNAFAQAVASEMKGLTRDVKNDINRQLFNDGSGVLAQINATQNNTRNINVDNPGTRFLKKSMVVDTYDARTGGTIALDSAVISGINSSVQMQQQTASTVTDNHFVAREDAYGDELMGIMGIVDTGEFVRTFQNVDRNVYLNWRANVLGNSGNNRTLTLALMQQAVDAAEIAGSGEVNFVVAHTSVRREYINALTPDVRFLPMELRGGMKKLTFAGGEQEMPFEFDKHCELNSVYFLSTEAFTWYVLKDFHFAQEDGAILSRLANTDAYQGWLKFYGNLGCDAPNANSKLENITATVTELGTYELA